MSENEKTSFQTIDEYISQQPMVKQEGLKRLREIIKNALPTATETISYQMPAFKTEKVIVWFAAYKNHYGFYPYPKTIVAFENQLTGYKTSKGAIQFPIDEPLPEDLIRKMILYIHNEIKHKPSKK
ncbi:MAG: DUF1801 domain-containing protein [Chitinophagaceae bacterium]|nr:DUF1801 domain-containing protein [Chitinophagaceae bacterium]